MSEDSRFFIGFIVAIVISSIVVAIIVDITDKRIKRRSSELQVERTARRWELDCKNCARIRHYKNTIKELTDERDYMEQTIRNLNIQNSILQSSLTKAKLHNETISEAQNEQT